MKFNTTPLVHTSNLNLSLLTHFTNFNFVKARLTFTSLKKSLLLKLTPWLKQVVKEVTFKQTAFKQTFKLLKPFNFCLQKNKKYNLTSSFIRSNLSSKKITLNYLQLSPSVYKTITLLNNLLFLHTQQFKLYKNYLYTYLQLITNINLLTPTLFRQQTNLPFYKNIFNQNLKNL